MRTPSLRRRITVSGLVVFTLLVLALDLFVYLTLQDRLEDTLDEVLAARVDLAHELDALVAPGELASRLASLGVPSRITTADGREVTAEPAVPRFAPGPPGPLGDVPHPRISRTITLADGSTAELFATRAGVEATLGRTATLLGMGTIAALGLALLLFRRAAEVAVAPLDDIVAAAGRTAAGRTGERLHPDTTGTELGQLATAYDAMLDSLEDALATARDTEDRTRRFVDDAAHQLRTPVTTIRACVEALLSESHAQARDELLGHLVRETARADRLLTSLLTMARLDTGQPPALAPTDLVALCRNEAERTRSLAPHLEIAVGSPAESGPPPVVDAAAVREAIANLLDNARRHAARSIDVVVSADGPRGSWQVLVSDDGPGIDPEIATRMFERFATFDGRGGTGLGLPIARAVAEAHAGSLTYEDGAFVLVLGRHEHPEPALQP